MKTYFTLAPASAFITLSACEKKTTDYQTENMNPTQATTAPANTAPAATTATTEPANADTSVSNAAQELPSKIHDFLKQHYPNIAIAKYKVKNEMATGREYEVKLNNGVEAEFDGNGNLKEIKDYQGVHTALVPQKIQTYASKNYPNIKIKKVDWKSTKNKIKVELLNDTDLEFDMDGNFLRID